MLKIPGLINNLIVRKSNMYYTKWIYNYFKEKIDWRKHKPGIEKELKSLDETRNYFIEEVHQNEMISEKYEKVLQL